MNITYDKSTIFVADLNKVKEDLKTIKKTYTDGDLAQYAYNSFSNLYNEVTGKVYPWCSDILRCNVEAFSHDFHGTHIRVTILNLGWKRIEEITFYATWLNDGGMEFDSETHWDAYKMRYNYTFNVREYKLDGSPYSIITTEGIDEAV